MLPVPQPRKKNRSLALVRPLPASSLDKFKRLSVVEREVDEELGKLGDLSRLTDCEPQLVLHLCNLVENITSCRLKGEEKKQFVLDKIKSLMPSLDNDNDLKWITKLIDVLCLVGAVTTVAKSAEAASMAKSVCGFFLK